MDMLAEVEPIYETLPGWRGNITGCRRFEELPKEAQTYVKTLEKLIGAPIKIVSVGPGSGRRRWCGDRRDLMHEMTCGSHGS